MRNDPGIVDPIAELRLVAKPAPDRLPAMLFLAALIHGVLIIGIAFNPALSEQFADAITVEVTIVAETDQNIDRPDRAEYIAQASQQGGGNTTEQVRPTAAEENNSPIDNLGEANGDSFATTQQRERSADQLVASERYDEQRVADTPRDLASDNTRVAMALERGADQTLPLPIDDRASMLIHDDDPRQLVISADTSQSEVAPYLAGLQRRIEAMGREYFPEISGLDEFSGGPTLQVRIDASGELGEVIIRRSSGSAIVDQAALEILRRSSPFDAFPEGIRDQYDSLTFTRKFLFAEDVLPATASVN